MHIVRFIIRIFHDARSPERQIHKISFTITICFPPSRLQYISATTVYTYSVTVYITLLNLCNCCQYKPIVTSKQILLHMWAHSKYYSTAFPFTTLIFIFTPLFQIKLIYFNDLPSYAYIVHILYHVRVFFLVLRAEEIKIYFLRLLER